MNYLRINNFKCFYKIDIPLNGLTIFAGANGNGKSTAIQALLFLRATIENCSEWKNNRYSLTKLNGLNVELNGSFGLALGNCSYVLPKNSNKNIISISLHNKKNKLSINYTANSNELWLTPKKIENINFKSSNIFDQEFYYLNAERIGPRISQGIKYYDFANTGYQGEFVAQLISDTDQNYRMEIEEIRRHENSKSPRLEQQVNAWLNELMPGVSIFATYNSDTHSAQIKIDNYFTKGDSTISTNIGFGISYILPIIVTGLIAKKGSYMIIENPEAHLHPSAQSKIGRFLSMIANSGVKVIVETHSDHVINGVQLSAALKEVDPNLISINFFSQSDKETQPLLETLSINYKGELSNWPKGFFDQTQIDFGELFRLRKNV